MNRSLALFAIAGSLASSALGAPDPSDEVIYQIMPIAWRDSNNDASRFGDFNGLTASLDYLQNLGVTSLYINPIFPSPAYHGYQHGAGDQLNSNFGTQTDFLNFVAAAHARSMKVYLDFVAYGISQTSIYYTSAHNNPSSPYDLWLAFTNSANSTYEGSVYNSWNGATVGFINWNLNNVNPVNLDIQWCTKWLDPNNDGNLADGVDGFRLDHAYSNAPEGWGATIAFWQTYCQGLRAKNPNVFMFCEPGDWGNYGADLLTPTGFDGVITKPLEFAMRDGINNASASGILSSINASIAQLPTNKYLVAEINDHDSDRLASALGGSVPKHKLAATLLLTQPFTPNIYFGDELGMQGTKQSYGSDADDIPNREPFKWNKVAGPPMSNYFVLNSGAYNNRFERDNDGRSVEEETGVPGSLLETYRVLIAARKASPALRRGSFTGVTAANGAVLSYVRYADAAHGGPQGVLVVMNLSGSATTTTLNLASMTVTGGTTTPTDLLTGATFPAITSANKGAYSITLPAYSFNILSAALVPPVVVNRTDIDGANIPTDFVPSGSLAATQDSPTALGDNVGELDQLFLRTEPTYLSVGITGNLPADGTAIALFVDSGTGGQNILSTANAGSPPGGVTQLNGTKFDAGFAPSTMYWINTAGALYCDQFTLLSAGGVTKVYRGSGGVGTGRGTLSGGTNPNNLQIAFNNSNTGGVTGSSVANAATATTGLEALLPLADLGLGAPSGQTVKVAAVIIKSDGTVTNQWLPGLGGRTTNLGLVPDLTTIAGNQFATYTLALRSACYANCDGSTDSPSLTAADFTCFLTAFRNGDSYANCDGSTGSPTLTAADFTCFLTAFRNGCP
jgi:glycosidase